MLDHYVRKHAKELLTYEAVSAAVDQLRESHPVTVANLIPHPVSLRTLFEVLRGLVAEGVVIHHILPILESVGRHAEHCESMPLLRSRVRSDIPLILCGPHLDENGFLPVIVVEKDVAREVFPDDSELQPVDSTLLTNVLDEIRRLAPPADSTRTPILLVPHSSRERIWAHCRSTFEDLLVLSPSEVPLGVRLKVLGNVSPESIGRLKPEPEDSPETLSEFWQRKPR
jgi:flagellar biosynthesis component FlhA